MITDQEKELPSLQYLLIEEINKELRGFDPEELKSIKKILNNLKA